MEIMFVFAVLILFILGAFVKNVINITNYKENESDNIFISLKGHKDDVEFMLREAISDIKWRNKHKNIICLDYGMDEETKKICSLMCKDYDFVYLKDNTDKIT